MFEEGVGPGLLEVLQVCSMEFVEAVFLGFHLCGFLEFNAVLCDCLAR